MEDIFSITQYKDIEFDEDNETEIIYKNILSLIKKNDINLLFTDKIKLMEPLLDKLGNNTNLNYYHKALLYDVCKYSECKRPEHIKYIVKSTIPLNAHRSIIDTIKPIDNAQEILDWIKTIPQPEQRTDAWFAYRNTVLTASSLSNAFEKKDSSHYNELYEEKVLNNRKKLQGKALQKGIRNEDNAQRIYEMMTGTKITEYGCIKHQKYNFLGASPDGIVTEASDPIYLARMLEIKCVMSRILYGVPLWKYWVQCQLQMEVCNLEYCDFFECNIREDIKDNMECIDFCNEILNGKMLNNYYGITIEYNENSSLQYIYSGVGLDSNELYKWYNTELIKFEEDDNYKDKWYNQTYFWRLDQYSLVTIKRNREWFELVKPELEQFWNMILDSREKVKEDPTIVDLLFHKKESKKYKKDKPIKNINENHVCLIETDDED